MRTCLRFLNWIYIYLTDLIDSKDTINILSLYILQGSFEICIFYRAHIQSWITNVYNKEDDIKSNKNFFQVGQNIILFSSYHTF